MRILLIIANVIASLLVLACLTGVATFINYCLKAFFPGFRFFIAAYLFWGIIFLSAGVVKARDWRILLNKGIYFYIGLVWLFTGIIDLFLIMSIRCITQLPRITFLCCPSRWRCTSIFSAVMNIDYPPFPGA